MPYTKRHSPDLHNSYSSLMSTLSDLLQSTWFSRSVQPLSRLSFQEPQFTVLLFLVFTLGCNYCNRAISRHAATFPIFHDTYTSSPFSCSTRHSRSLNCAGLSYCPSFSANSNYPTPLLTHVSTLSPLVGIFHTTPAFNSTINQYSFPCLSRTPPKTYPLHFQSPQPQNLLLNQWTPM